MIVWELDGPYVVAFTTREGGVSTGPYASLNLGSYDDDPAHIAENRRRACLELDLDPSRLAVNRQCHSTVVNRAAAGQSEVSGDALWSDEPGLPMLALSADCVPVAIATTAGPPALAVVHAGWRGLADGIILETVSTLTSVAASASLAAVVGPSVGPCCYEVGEDVAARFDDDLYAAGMLDLWTATERRLQAAGVVRVDRTDTCTRCNPERFFSHRRSGPVRGTQGVIGALRG